jgi:hypothetical protein
VVVLKSGEKNISVSQKAPQKTLLSSHLVDVVVELSDEHHVALQALGVAVHVEFESKSFDETSFSFRR